MQTIAILTLIIGIVCLFAELFMPGFGLFGILGFICILASWGVTIFAFKLGFIIVLIEIILLGLGGFFIIKRLKRMQIYSKFILSDIVEQDKKQIGNMEHFVGKEGVAKTDLRPFGSAEFNGINIDVLSDDGYIKKDCLIKVVKFEENKLYVKMINSN